MTQSSQAVRKPCSFTGKMVEINYCASLVPCSYTATNALFVHSVKTAAIDTKGPDSLTPDGKPLTTFLMELREAAPMPEPAEFARFLTTCLGFTTKIRSVSSKFFFSACHTILAD